MARSDSWFRTYVLAVFFSSRPKRRLTKEELNISAPLPETVEHHSPIPYIPRSISAVDLPSEPEPTFHSMHARRNSDDATPRRLTVHIREPSSHMPPPTSFPSELPPRSDCNSLGSPTSPSNRLSKRFSQFGTTTREAMSSQSAGNPRPVSYFAPGFDISIADMTPIHDHVNEKQQRQVKRMSTINVMRSMENDQRRESKRMSRRMTVELDMYQRV